MRREAPGWQPPQRPRWLERLIAHGDSVGGAASLVPLAPDALVATAAASTGLDDFGQGAPERLLWGSDWPHPNWWKPMPNDADLLDLLLEWEPDPAVRKRILVDNPAELFGFPPL